MSSGSSYPRCEIDLRSSRTLHVYSLLLVILSMAAPWYTPLPLFFVGPLSMSMLALAPALLRWARGELSRIVWHGDGRWTLVAREGTVHEECHPLPGSWIGVDRVLLRLQCVDCGNVFRAALLPDNCDPDRLRRLIVRLNVTPDDVLFGTQSSWSRWIQWIGSALPAKFAGTSTVSRGGCRSSRSG